MSRGGERARRRKLFYALFALGFICGICYCLVRGISRQREEVGIGVVTTALFERAVAGCIEKEYMRSASVLGTSMKVLVHCKDRKVAEEAIDAAIKRVVEIEEKMSRFKTGSELYRLNRDAAVRAVRVSDELFSVIKRSLDFCRLSGGALDITVVPLLKVYRDAERRGRPPSSEEIEKALRKVGWRKVIVDEREKTVKFAVDGMALDLGATAKGYAVDSAVEVLKSHGIEHALVEIGGEVYVYGGQANGDGWTVGIVDPRRRRRYLRVVVMREGAVATSGNYERFYEIGKEKFSHIVDPRNGRTADAAVSVSVIADDTFSADSLATAVSVLGPEDGIKLINSIEDTEVLILWKDRDGERLVESKGFARFIKQ